MPIAVALKNKLVKEYQRHDKDGGSPEVQIALLTQRITELTEHVRGHHHDFSSRRGLQLMVGKRNRLLRYLQRTNRDSYHEVIKKLGLRK
jgi:small subunit ribosomal protein S15